MRGTFGLSFDCLWIYGVLVALFALLDLDRPISELNVAQLRLGLESSLGVPVEAAWREGSLWLAPGRGAPVAVPGLLVNPLLPLYLAVVTALARSRGTAFFALLVIGALVTVSLNSIALAAVLCAIGTEALPDAGLARFLAEVPEEFPRAVAAVPVFVGALLARALPAPAPGDHGPRAPTAEQARSRMPAPKRD